MRQHGLHRHAHSHLLLLLGACLAAAPVEAQGSPRKGAAKGASSKPVAPSAAADPVVAVVAVVAEAEPAVTTAAMLAGVVEDSVGTPILDAEIAILGTTLRTRSGTGGIWRLSGVLPGPVLISARRMGYHAQTLTVHMKEGESRALDLTLLHVEQKPFVLPERVVFAPQKSFRSVFHQGFYARKLSYPGGTYFAREEIMQLQPSYTSDVFRQTPGLFQSRDRRGQTQWVMRGVSSSQACPIRFFIDGMNVPLNGMSIDELVQPNDIEGIEIYKGLSTVPAEFSGRSLQDDSRCGVVAIWTRVTR